MVLQQEALRVARDQQKRNEERLHSPQLVFDQSLGPSSTGGTVTPALPTTIAATAVGTELASSGDENMNFANQYGNQEVETAKSSKMQNLNTLIPQGTMIAAILETAVESDLPGMIRAVVSENIYDFNGSSILIPKGSHLIGRYRSGLVRGQTRVFVIWNRLLRQDGVTINIASEGADELGRSGMDGDLDTHFFERFGSSILLSMIDSGLQAGVNSLNNSNTATVALESGQDFSKSAEIALQNSIAIPPTISINQGTKIQVFVGKDLDFSPTDGSLSER